MNTNNTRRRHRKSAVRTSAAVAKNKKPGTAGFAALAEIDAMMPGLFEGLTRN